MSGVSRNALLRKATFRKLTSILSRGAASDYSPRRKPWVNIDSHASPEGAKELLGFTFGEKRAASLGPRCIFRIAPRQKT